MAVIELVKNSYDADATVCSGALRMLTILDEYTGECHVLRADWALRSVDVLEWASKAIQEHGALEYLRSDNGSELKRSVGSLPKAARRASEARQFIDKEVSAGSKRA